MCRRGGRLPAACDDRRPQRRWGCALNVLETLGVLRRGRFVEDLAAELGSVVTAVRATGKAGKLTVELTVKPAGKGDDVTLTVADKIVSRMPSPDIGETILYATADGALTRRDPRQGEIFEPRDVNDRRAAQ